MDKEQKIAEIREALEKIDRGDLFEIAMAHEKSGEWLRFLLNELERLEQEHDKLIEVLRWYAVEENQKLDEATRHWENVYSPYEMDGGQRARNILREIGAPAIER